MASILQSLPCAFEKEAMLRIRQRRFTVAHVEKFRIELLDVVEHRAGFYVSGRRPGRCVCAVFKLGVCKKCDAFDAIAHVAPECRNVLGARESP